MNIPLMTVTRSIALLPELARDTLGFARWDYGHLLSIFDRDREWEEDDLDPADEPLPVTTSARLALELVMIARATKGNPDAFHKLVNDVAPSIQSPQHAMDVTMAMAGMVSALADDDDLLRFGETILHHEGMHAHDQATTDGDAVGG